MLSKDFENLELRLQKIREESEDIFELGKNRFEESYAPLLQEVFQRDILGAKKAIAALWQIDYAESMRGEKNFDESLSFEKHVRTVIGYLPLTLENKKDLQGSILGLSQRDDKALENYFGKDSFSRDTLYPIIEGLLGEGSISREEYALIESSYSETGSITEALGKLPENIRAVVSEDISAYTHGTESEKEQSFHDEYYRELEVLHGAGYDVFPLKRFVSKSYFKNPGKLRKKEHPRSRLRRTFKMALLRILKIKFGSIDAEKLLKQFDQCETFQEMFLLLYRLFEILGENSENKESFALIDEANIIEKLVFKAEDTKEKILEGERVTANISSLVSETEAGLEEGVLEKILEDDTHFHGDEVHFAHGEDEMAGVYSEATKAEDTEDDEEDVIDSGDTLEGNFERLKEYFKSVDEEKRTAFLEGRFDTIDSINEKLVSIESKIEKVAKLLGEEM